MIPLAVRVIVFACRLVRIVIAYVRHASKYSFDTSLTND
jgi:hypothetical protein